MLATKRFDNPTIPTNREVCFEHFRNFFRFQFIPPDRSAFGAVKRWLVVVIFPNSFPQETHFLPSYHLTKMLRSRQSCGESSTCNKHSCPQSRRSGQREQLSA